jgi:hypothetical protein
MSQIGWKDPISDFNNFVYAIAFGDDNLLSVRDEVIHQFTPDALQAGLLKVGMKYTNEAKTQSMGSFRPILEVSFLKRSFRFEPILGRYVAPLDITTILETPYWTKRGSSADKIALDNLQFSILELSLHGENVFVKYVPKMTELAFEKYRHSPEVIRFNRALLMCCAREEHY